MPSHPDRVRRHYDDRWWETHPEHHLPTFNAVAVTILLVLLIAAVVYGALVESARTVVTP